MSTTTDVGAPAAPATHLPARDDDAPPPVPRSALGKPTPDQRFARIGSWVGGLGLAWLVTLRLLPLEGLAWFLIVWFVLGVAVTAVTAAMADGVIEVKDRKTGERTEVAVASAVEHLVELTGKR